MDIRETKIIKNRDKSLKIMINFLHFCQQFSVNFIMKNVQILYEFLNFKILKNMLAKKQ